MASTPARVTVFDLLCLLPVLWFVAYADQYLFRFYGVPPLYWQLAFLSLIMAVILLRWSQGIGILRGRSARFRRGAVAVIVYVNWTALNFLYSGEGAAAAELTITRLKVALFIVVFAYVFDHPRVRAPLAWGAALVAVFGSVLNIQDFFLPTYSVVPGRAAGFYGNPNIAGFTLTILGVFAMLRMPFPMRLVFWTLLSVAVFLTFSRASWGHLLLTTFGLAYLGHFGAGRGRLIYTGLIAGLVLFFGVMLATGELYYLVLKTPIADYLDSNTMARLGFSQSVIQGYSADVRGGVAAAGFEYFLDNPLFGGGMASSYALEGGVGVHNMYVLFLVEGGLPGILIYLGFLGLLALGASPEQRLILLNLVLAGFFSHNLLDTTANAVIFAFLLSAPAERRAPRPAAEAAGPV